jgi:hypothetical protein
MQRLPMTPAAFFHDPDLGFQRCGAFVTFVFFVVKARSFDHEEHEEHGGEIRGAVLSPIIYRCILSTEIPFSFFPVPKATLLLAKT